MRATASATTDSHAAPLIAPSAKVTLRGAGGVGCGSRSGSAASSSCPMTVTQERPRRVPTTTRGTTSTLSPGSSAKPKLPKLIRPVPGTAHLVADHGRAGDLLPPVGRVGEPVGARGAAAGGDAPGDHALATTQPGHRLVGGQQVEQDRGQRVGGDHLDGAGDETAGGRVGRRVGWSRARSLRGDRSHSVGRIRVQRITTSR